MKYDKEYISLIAEISSLKGVLDYREKQVDRLKTEKIETKKDIQVLTSYIKGLLAGDALQTIENDILQLVSETTKSAFYQPAKA